MQQGTARSQQVGRACEEGSYRVVMDEIHTRMKFTHKDMSCVLIVSQKPHAIDREGTAQSHKQRTNKRDGHS